MYSTAWNRKDDEMMCGLTAEAARKRTQREQEIEFFYERYDMANHTCSSIISVLDMDKEQIKRLHDAVRAVRKWENRGENYARVLPKTTQDQLERFVFGDQSTPFEFNNIDIM